MMKDAFNQKIKFSGYAAVFNNTDLHNDILLPSALKKVKISNNYPSNANYVKLLFEHNNASQIGTITKVKKDAKGIFVEGCIDKNSLMLAGIDNMSALNNYGLSIGYFNNGSVIDKSLKKRYISNITLEEVSIVKNPANKMARINFTSL